MRDYLSASFVEDWLRCPYRAITVRESKLDTGSVFTELGSLVHKTLDKYYETDASISEVFEDEMDNMGVLDLKMYKDAQKMLKSFELTEAISESEILEREVEFLMDTEEGEAEPHCLVKGIIDRVDYHGDGVYEISDYKTSSYVKDRWELANDMQMCVYDLAFWRMWETGIFFDIAKYPPPKRLLITIHYLRYGKWRLNERTPEEREMLEAYLIGLFHKVQNTKTLPQKINKYCAYCPLRNDCNAFKKATEENPTLFALSDMTPNELVGYYKELKTQKTATEKRIDEVKSALGVLVVDEDGNLETDDFNVTANTKKYKVRNKEDVRNILEPLGLFDAVIEVSNRKLDKVAKDNDIKRDIDRITTYNFSKPIIDVKSKPAFIE